MNALLYVTDTYNPKFHETITILQIVFCLFSADKGSGKTWSWSRISSWYRSYEWVELCLHSPSTLSWRE